MALAGKVVVITDAAARGMAREYVRAFSEVNKARCGKNVLTYCQSTR